MKAISINRIGDYDDLEIADKFVKRVEQRAVYMKKTSMGTLLFIPTERDDQSFVYEIDNKLYSALWTNKYDELVKHFRNCIEQITLF